MWKADLDVNDKLKSNISIYGELNLVVHLARILCMNEWPYYSAYSIRCRALFCIVAVYQWQSSFGSRWCPAISKDRNSIQDEFGSQ